MGRTSLYRHFNASGQLLYVGIATCHIRRIEQHRTTAPWFWDIAEIRIEHFPSRQEALAAESLAIRTEGPMHNGTPGRPSLGVVPTVVRISPDDMARIDRLVGPSKRAEFIRTSVRNALSLRQ